VTITERQIENDSVLIIDDTLAESEITEFYELINGLPYRKKEVDHDGDEYPIFSVDFQTDKFLNGTKVGARGQKLLEELKSNQHQLYRSYVNMCHYGDVEYPHRDCAIDAEDITVLYYANTDWDYTWGGETKFYENKDTVFSVLPKPGRFVIFKGAIEHMGSIPSRLCKSSRYTVAMKFQKKQA